MKLKLMCFIAAAVLAAGCAGRQIDVLTNVDPAFDFSKPRTYKWQNIPAAELLKNIYPAPGVETRELEAGIKAAADAELQRKGFQLADPADLVLTYAATASDRVEANPTPDTSDWDPTQNPTEYGAAVLALDFLDPSTNARVWRGAAMTDLRSGEGRQRVGGVVVRILEEFPPKQK